MKHEFNEKLREKKINKNLHSKVTILSLFDFYDLFFYINIPEKKIKASTRASFRI